MAKEVKVAAKRGRPAKATGVEATKSGATSASSSDAVVGFEEKLWQMADKLRNNMDAAEFR